MSGSSHAGPSGVDSRELTSPPPPTKNRHKLTPHEAQAQAIERLLANPEKNVYIPLPPQEKTIRPPREMMKNVTGSSAGAGSGEFHVYKHARRREYERIKLMEESAQKTVEKSEFAKKQAAQAALDEAKTNKNRAKRDKKKLAALKAKAAARGEDPRKVKLPGAQANDEADVGPQELRGPGLSNADVGRIQFKRPKGEDDDDDDGSEAK